MSTLPKPSQVSTAVKLSVVDSVREPRPVELLTEALSAKERLLLGLRRLAIAWGAAAVAVLIPLVHFVLVPGLLLAGPIAAALAARRTVRLVTGQAVPCAKCAVPLRVEGERLGWPARLDCPSCGAALSAAP